MRVLIADDDPLSLILLEKSLDHWGYEIVSCKNGNDAWGILEKEDAPNLIILDWVMPGMEGIDICRRLRSRNSPNYMYVILLTGKSERKDIIKGLESGADDYIVKPFHPEELKYRLQIGKRVIELEQRIMKLASTDYLTGLLNRRAFMERVEAEVNRSRRQGQNMGVIIMDIDHFKYVNDQYGHQAGDEVLQNVAVSLTRCCRSYDYVGRYGGEEFIVCLPGADQEISVRIAERMRMAIKGDETVLADARRIKITASFGVSTLDVNQEESLDSLINRADRLLYQAKNEGRNRVVAVE
ncbi:MAG: diguanylate cyclase [Bacillota bacterium]|nr:diguanylate cyclase [Bacillota bacterium]